MDPFNPAARARVADQRAIEGLMHEKIREQLGQKAPDTPLSRAQAIMYRAFNERDPRRREEMALEALNVSPDCADAYVVLAEQCPTPRKKIVDLYQKGLAAAERALGPEVFQESVGQFWGLLQTRPYMRARHGLALILWAVGRQEEAIGHCQELLRLNPEDNQGVRYVLADFFVDSERHDLLKELLARYPQDESATWAYTKALLAFRQQGDSAEARALLAAAKKANPHIARGLVKRNVNPGEEVNAYSPGHESEAQYYIHQFLTGWKYTAGAIPWLKANDPMLQRQFAPVSSVKGPLTLIKKWLRDRVPQQQETWQVDYRQPPAWISIADQAIRPFLFLVGNPAEETVLGHAVLVQKPDSGVIWDELVEAMKKPLAGPARRPTQLQVSSSRTAECWDHLKPHLAEIGVALEVIPQLPFADACFEGICASLGKPTEPPTLLDTPGLTPERLGQAYEAAAFFYQQKPWLKVGSEAAIRVECAGLSGGPWYTLPLGQSGIVAGLAVYTDYEAIKNLWRSAGNPEFSGTTEAASLMFGDPWNIAMRELLASQEHGWKVASDDAYPLFVCSHLDGKMRLPRPRELDALEACARSVPLHIQRHPQHDTSSEEYSVQLGKRALALKLAWMPELE